jgi:hypothetical protein
LDGAREVFLIVIPITIKKTFPQHGI